MRRTWSMPFFNISWRIEKENATYYLFLMTRCWKCFALRTHNTASFFIQYFEQTIARKDQVVPLMFAVPCLSPFRFPVWVVAAPIRLLLSTLVALVLLLYFLPVLFVLLLFQGLVHYRCHCRIRVYNGRIHIVPLDSPSLGYLCK